jgi:hypothetical protein
MPPLTALETARTQVTYPHHEVAERRHDNSPAIHGGVKRQQNGKVPQGRQRQSAFEFLATDETRKPHGFFKPVRAGIFVASSSTNQPSSVRSDIELNAINLTSPKICEKAHKIDVLSNSSGYISCNPLFLNKLHNRYFTGRIQNARRFPFVARQNSKKGQYIEGFTKRWGS